LAEFWRRWHISLSTWFRDYLFIPLGGSRKGPSRTTFNLLVTFIISGLWHGASINYLV
jgi:D-alanyl-lipoteichoic acid acyltransferase DltB (MBOAT superfamily)